MFTRKLMMTIQSEKEKKLIVFDYMIADIMTNRGFEAIIKKLLIRYGKLNISLVFYHSILFFCCKRCQIKYNILFDYENPQQNRIKNIATDHSADIDYQGFKKIYRECTKEAYSFLTIDTTLPASDPLRFRKHFWLVLMKMTVTDQIKILNKKKVCKM